MSHNHPAAPVTKPFFTLGTYIMLIFMAAGAAVAGYRFIFGIGAVANLNDQYPWGLWIGFDVATGVALAAGGFTTSALAHIFHRREFEAIVRPALLTAMLGYTFVVLGLLVDLGRYYNVWHPVMPWMWSGHSVLFEVGMCVTFYLNVLYIEFLPIVVERFHGRVNLPGPLKSLNGFVDQTLGLLDRTLGPVMFIFVILGVVLSCMHQSSLGALMLIAPQKMHPLWFTPILPFLFLLSAVAVGYPMVIFESILASKVFGRHYEMDILNRLARFIPMILMVYLGFKLWDLIHRDAMIYVWQWDLPAQMFCLELGVGVVLPILLLQSQTVRSRPWLLFTAAGCVVAGVAINRINVFLVAYTPVYKTAPYFPSVGEFTVTIGLVAALMFIYRLLVTYLPVLPVERHQTNSWAVPAPSKVQS